MEFEKRDENRKLCQRDKTDQASACLARNYKFKNGNVFVVVRVNAQKMLKRTNKIKLTICRDNNSIIL